MCNVPQQNYHGGDILTLVRALESIHVQGEMRKDLISAFYVQILVMYLVPYTL